MRIVGMGAVAVAVVLAGMGAACVLIPRCTAQGAGPAPGDLWLSGFVGRDVDVVFYHAWRGSSGQIGCRARLVHADEAGVVLKFAAGEVFFSYAYIFSIDIVPPPPKEPRRFAR